MEARRRLSLPPEHPDKETFLCCALDKVLLDEGVFLVNVKHFQKLFTEFRQLWDGYFIAVMEQESAVQTLLKSGGEAYPPSPASL